jgi:hypothetical protein
LVRQLLTHLTPNPVEPYQISTRKSLTVGLQMLQKMLKYCNARCNLGFGGVANIRQKEARYVKERYSMKNSTKSCTGLPRRNCNLGCIRGITVPYA